MKLLTIRQWHLGYVSHFSFLYYLLVFIIELEDFINNYFVDLPNRSQFLHTSNIFCLPLSLPRRLNIKRMETKKAWEILTFSPIPVVRPSHCPSPRISNAVSPRQVIIYSTTSYTLLYSSSWDIIYPRRRFVALPLWRVQSCEV